MSEGFITIPRATFEADWYKEANLLTRAMWFLLRSLAEETGQTTTSWSALARQLSWQERGRRVVPSIKKCRSSGAFLRAAGQIAWRGAGTRRGAGMVVTGARRAFQAEEVSAGTGDWARTFKGGNVKRESAFFMD